MGSRHANGKRPVDSQCPRWVTRDNNSAMNVSPAAVKVMLIGSSRRIQDLPIGTIDMKDKLKSTPTPSSESLHIQREIRKWWERRVEPYHVVTY
jgi:hypothetical protein